MPLPGMADSETMTAGAVALMVEPSAGLKITAELLMASPGMALPAMVTSNTILAEPLPATLMFDYPTIDAISKYLLQTLDSNGVQGVPATHVERQSTGSTAKRAQEIEALSDDEVEARLLKRLERK